MRRLLSILTQNVEAFSQMAKQRLKLAEFLIETGRLANCCLPTKALFLLIAFLDNSTKKSIEGDKKIRILSSEIERKKINFIKKQYGRRQLLYDCQKIIHLFYRC